jgi:hypothetical protein
MSGDWTPPPPPPPLTPQQKAAALAIVNARRGYPCEMNTGSEPLGVWWMCATYKLDPTPVGPIVWAWVGPNVTSDPSECVVEGTPLTRAQLRALLAQVTPGSGLLLAHAVQVVLKTDGLPWRLSLILNGDPQGQHKDLLKALHGPKKEKTSDGRRLAFFATSVDGDTRRFTCKLDGDGPIELAVDESAPRVPGLRGVREP